MPKFTEIPHHILKDFCLNAQGLIAVTPDASEYLNITIETPENGSVNPSGTLSIKSGSDLTLTFTPNDGYSVSDVLIDDISQGNITEYTFENVTKNHSVEVLFESAVISHFEDWDGETITSNNPWQVSYTSWPTPLSISSSNLIADGTGGLYGARVSLYHYFGSDIPIPIPEQKMYIKMSIVSDGVQHPETASPLAYFYISDDVHDVTIYFLYNYDYGSDKKLYLSTLGETSYSNDGTVAIDLSPYGITGAITWFQMDIATGLDPLTHVRCEVDFIDFT